MTKLQTAFWVTALLSLVFIAYELEEIRGELADKNDQPTLTEVVASLKADSPPVQPAVQSVKADGTEYLLEEIRDDIRKIESRVSIWGVKVEQ